MNSKKVVLPFVLLSIIPLLAIITCLSMVIFKFNYGYYPVPFIMKKTYYAFKYQSSRQVEQVVKPHFNINTKGCTVDYELKNMLNVPYYVYIKFNPKDKVVPTSYQYKGSLEIAVTLNNLVQYLHITNNISKVTLVNIGKVAYPLGFTDGYYVAVLPFPLNKTTYNNAKLKITVLNIDNNLIPYAEDVQISIFPEIDLDSDVSDTMLATGIIVNK